MTSISVKCVDEIRFDEERRSLHLDFFGIPFVMGSHVGALLSSVENSHISRSPIILGVTGNGASCSLLFFRQHSYDHRERLFSVELSSLNQITSITVYENSCLDPLRPYSLAHLLPVRGKSNTAVSPAISGVSLKLTSSTEEDGTRTKTLSIVKAPKGIAPREPLSPYTSSLTLTKNTVQTAHHELGSALESLARMYELRRPRNFTETTQILSNRLAHLRSNLAKVTEGLGKTKTSLSRYRSLLADEDLVYNKFKAEVIVEQREGTITSDLRISSKISHGRGYDYYDNTPTKFNVQNYSEIEKVVSAHADSHMAEINSKNVYDPISGTYVVSIPSTVRVQGYNRNPLHARLSDLLSNYTKSAERHGLYTKQVEDLTSTLERLTAEERSLQSSIGAILTKLNSLPNQ